MGFVLLPIKKPTTYSLSAAAMLSQVHRLSEALNVVGNPLDQSTLERISKIKTLKSDLKITNQIQEMFDPLCLAKVEIQKDGPSKVSLGSADQNSWNKDGEPFD